MILSEVRGWAKGTLPTYNDRRDFFEEIVNGDPDPVQLIREAGRARCGRSSRPPRERPPRR